MPRSRRGYGEGSIHQRTDGRWSAIISLGYDEKGKRKRQYVYGATKKEVQDKLSRLQNSKVDGTLCATNRLTLATYLDHWLKDAVTPSVRPTTYICYEGVVRNQIKPHIGGVALSKLTPIHVQGLYSKLADEGASPRVRQLTHAVLRRSLRQAVRWGLVVRNVCDAVAPPSVPKSNITPLSAEQASKLLSTADGDRLEALYVLAIGTGMRMGELFALQWSDVDLDSEALTVRQTLVEVKGKLSLAEPKTAKSRRRIELPVFAVVALWDHRKRALAEGHKATGFVFCNVHGGPLRRSNFTRQQFKPMLKAAELPDIRFHDLRHTAATLLLAEGVHPKIVQERLGHAQIPHHS